MKKHKLFPGFAAGIAIALTIGCGDGTKTVEGPDYLASHVDTTVNPADDFFAWANGGWIKSNPIPASEVSWTVAHLVMEETYTNLKKISMDAAANPAPDADAKKIGDFWSTGMDSAKAEKLGYSPLQKELDAINGITTIDNAIDVGISFEPLGVGAFYGGFYVTQDARHSDKMAVHLWQGGIGLPDRDYYFNTDTETKAIREAYPKHIAEMLKLTGYPADKADAIAAQVFTFETGLAESSRKLEVLRDDYANYNKMAVGDVTQKLTPSINWLAICERHGCKNVDSVIVGQPEFFTALDKQLHATSVDVLKAYLQYHLVSTYAEYLSKPIDDADFNFYGKMLQGAETQRERWKRVLDAEEDAMGMVLGKLWSAAYFDETAKQRYNNLVEAIRGAYAVRIQSLDWMSDTTKTKALDKLQRMSKKVGYPDKWKDYSALVVGTNSFCENMMNASRWQFNDRVSKYGKPIDRTEWEMTPQTYNAYYNPSNNEIVLPAAIFIIPGLADSLADDAMVYGYAAASTIGHEITHGFDDQGRNFDAAGNLTNWWTSTDAEKFKTRAQVMIDQFSAFEPLPGKFINGEATIGENIADYGGILLAWDAFIQTDQYKKGEKKGGYTPAQRYFMGYALGWMGHQREEALAQRLLTDVHSPGKWRVNGPFANVSAFHEAFNVKEGNNMWIGEKERVMIW
ncbi:MAG TPA: M13 family metallopeptidase [Bacteroidia bacterium]|nr:M13 family metallopeptidase [Bacteroidia bacterium]